MPWTVRMWLCGCPLMSFFFFFFLWWLHVLIVDAFGVAESFANSAKTNLLEGVLRPTPKEHFPTRRQTRDDMGLHDLIVLRYGSLFKNMFSCTGRRQNTSTSSEAFFPHQLTKSSIFFAAIALVDLVLLGWNNQHIDFHPASKRQTIHHHHNVGPFQILATPFVSRKPTSLPCSLHRF